MLSKNQLIFLGVLIFLLALISLSVYIGSSNTSQDTAIDVRTISTTSANLLGYNIVAGWAEPGTENINIIPAFGVGRTNLSYRTARILFRTRRDGHKPE